MSNDLTVILEEMRQYKNFTNSDYEFSLYNRKFALGWISFHRKEFLLFEQPLYANHARHFHTITDVYDWLLEEFKTEIFNDKFKGIVNE